MVVPMVLLAAGMMMLASILMDVDAAGTPVVIGQTMFWDAALGESHDNGRRAEAHGVERHENDGSVYAPSDGQPGNHSIGPYRCGFVDQDTASSRWHKRGQAAPVPFSSVSIMPTPSGSNFDTERMHVRPAGYMTKRFPNRYLEGVEFSTIELSVLLV
jgi:hypothetical protein